MTNLFLSKTNFTAGELSPDLLGRVDLSSYANGALTLENVFIEPTGGIHRRPGLKYLDTLNQKGRLIAYEQDSNHTYLFIIQNAQTLIYQNDILIDTLSSPWTESQLDTLCWCSLPNGLLVVHPEIQPQQFTCTQQTWTLSPFVFATSGGYTKCAYSRFDKDNVCLSASANTGNITLTSTSALFDNTHLNQIFKIADGYVKITAITDSTRANAQVLKNLSDSGTDISETRYWGEPAWSATRGWPRTVATYQSRLVFGGSQSQPHTLWFSQTDDLGNFEAGDALDSEAITFELMSNQGNKICALFAGRHLQIFTTSAEWMVSGNPLTPTSIQLNRQTQVGSNDTRYIPPVGVDGATIFAAANGSEIREFLFSDLEGIYQATDLSLLAHHLIHQPIDMAYDKYQRQAYILMQDGTLSTLTSFRAEDMQSWTRQTTNGKFISVAMSNKQAYFIIQSDNTFFLEKFSDDVHCDLAQIQTASPPQKTWTGLNYLNDRTVCLVADDRVQDKQIVQNGQITLNVEASTLEIGVPFTHKVEPLPPMASANNGTVPVNSCRFVRGVFRLINTKSFEIDTGTGLHQEMVNDLMNYTLDSSPQNRTTDLIIRGLGWNRHPLHPLWSIQGQEPLPFQLVSVASDIKIGG